MLSKRGLILAIVGPTGIGKTKLSISLALALGGEVVSVDSLQVYRDGRILTAQASQEEMKGVRHHMIACLEAFEEPDDYLEHALAAIDDVHRRGKPAILVGGSTSLMEPLLFYPSVEQCCPLVITLFAKMDVIGNLCDGRIDSMIKDGLIGEIETLNCMHKSLAPNEDASVGVWKAIGFPEIRPYFDHQADDARAIKLLEDGVARMKHATRQYAEKQLRWIWTSLLYKVHQRGLDTLLFQVEGKETFKEDVEDKALELTYRWLELTRMRQSCSLQADVLEHGQIELAA